MDHFLYFSEALVKNRFIGVTPKPVKNEESVLHIKEINI